jgi:hypothetical protein
LFHKNLIPLLKFTPGKAEAFPKPQFLEDEPCLSSSLRFRGKSGLLAAFPKAIPKANRVWGMTRSTQKYSTFRRKIQQKEASQQGERIYKID